MLTITSEHQYYEYTFDRKFQAKLYTPNNFFEQPEEYLIELMGKKEMEPNKFSLSHTKNEVLNLTSETSSSEDCFETKLQAMFYKSDQILEQPE